MNSDPSARRALNMRAVALALLVGAALLMVVAAIFEARDPAWGYLRALGEAAVIGGLADWFAVVALFRRPLGLPIPHTAIIPTNKDRIGEALGRFVEHNFLTPEVVARKLGEIDFAGKLGQWLADPVRVEPMAAALTRFVPRALDALGEQPMRAFLEANLVHGIRGIELGPLAAQVLEVLTAHNQHEALIDELIRAAERLLREAEPELRVRVTEKTAWLWKRLGVDAAISDRMIEAAEQALAEISADPQHAWRKRFRELIEEYVYALRYSPQVRERAEALKPMLIEHPLLAEYIGRVWDELRAHIRADAQAPDSRLRNALQGSLQHLGDALLDEPAVRAALNGWLRALLADLARTRSAEVAQLIADTVRAWDARTMAQRIEQAVGRDLQYIRVNGTLIGGLVGLALYTLSRSLPA